MQRAEAICIAWLTGHDCGAQAILPVTGPTNFEGQPLSEPAHSDCEQRSPIKHK